MDRVLANAADDAPPPSLNSANSFTIDPLNASRKTKNYHYSSSEEENASPRDSPRCYSSDEWGGSYYGSRQGSSADELDDDSSSGAKRRRWTQWSEEEDLYILASLRMIGTQYAHVASQMHNRTGDAVRNRWHRLQRVHALGNGGENDTALQALLSSKGWTPAMGMPRLLAGAGASAGAGAGAGALLGLGAGLGAGGGSAQVSPRGSVGAGTDVKRVAGSAYGRSMWSAEEDALIEDGVRKFGCKWRQIAARLPGRTDSSVRNRWMRIQKERDMLRVTPHQAGGTVGNDGGVADSSRAGAGAGAAVPAAETLAPPAPLLAGAFARHPASNEADSVKTYVHDAPEGRSRVARVKSRGRSSESLRIAPHLTGRSGGIDAGAAGLLIDSALPPGGELGFDLDSLRQHAAPPGMPSQSSMDEALGMLPAPPGMPSQASVDEALGEIPPGMPSQSSMDEALGMLPAPPAVPSQPSMDDGLCRSADFAVPSLDEAEAELGDHSLTEESIASLFEICELEELRARPTPSPPPAHSPAESAGAAAAAKLEGDPVYAAWSRRLGVSTSSLIVAMSALALGVVGSAVLRRARHV